MNIQPYAYRHSYSSTAIRKTIIVSSTHEALIQNVSAANCVPAMEKNIECTSNTKSLTYHHYANSHNYVVKHII